MPLLIALLGLVVVALIWTNRAPRAEGIVANVSDMASDVRLAARRFGFRRRADLHPVESIEDPRLAIATIAGAFIELDTLPTSEQRALLAVQLRATLRIDETEAEELGILGRWLMNECGGAEPAIARVSRKLFKLSGANHTETLMHILKGSLAGSQLSDRQKDALEDITRALRPR